MTRSVLTILVTTVLLSSQPSLAADSAASKNSSAVTTTMENNNPLYVQSVLPFQAPPFDKIKDNHYQPAIEEGMKQHLVEVETIADTKESTTFENTIVALEKSGVLLTRASTVFFNVVQSNTNDTLQKVRAEIAPKLSAHNDAIYLNAPLFQRIKTLYDQREKLNLDTQSKRLLERYYENFVRSGALLADADKKKLTLLNEEQSRLSNQFSENLLKETTDSAVIVDDKKQLEGLSDADIAAAAEAAKQRNLEGKWVLSLQNTSGQPFLTSLKNRELRERIYKASIERGNRDNKADNKAIIARLAQIQAQRAQLLGSSNFASFNLVDEMAKTPQQAMKLLSDMAPAAVSKAKEEAAKMQAIIDKQKGGFKLAPWDWAYYAEQVRKAEYDLDEAQIKPYFELNRVLQDGVFFAAQEMYGLTFKERKDIPVYQPDVRVFEVFDADGKSMALYYGDYYKRDNKSGGAWMNSFVDQNALFGTKPVIVNVTNFTKPAAGQPALLSFDDVNTLFHEFGHALHGMLARAHFPLFAGTNVPRDFVEFPSQFNEHWALDTKVLANYAKHYKTGEPMPQALVDKIKKSDKFDQGFATTEYLAAALLDMEWHSLPADAPLQEVNKFETAALKKHGVDFAPVPPRYRTTYFAHIWGGGYAAGYYAYLWSDVLSADAYQWFVEHGGMTRENGQRYRDFVLAKGGTEEVMSVYTKFRGKEPSVKPLIEERGLQVKAAASK